MLGKSFHDRVIARLDKIDRKQLEGFLTRVVQERRFFETIVDHLVEAVLVTDHDYKVLYLNRMACSLLGLPETREMLGKPLREKIRSAAFRHVIERFDLEGEPWMDQEIVVTEPPERVLRVDVIPVRQGTERASTLVIIVRDLTDRRREEAERSRAEKLESLSTLTAGVAHEIKNPLNSLKIHTQLLEQALRNPDAYMTAEARERAQKSARIVLEETDRVAHIVDQFIQAARPTKPRLAMRNVNEVIDRVLAIVRPELEQKRIRVRLQLEAGAPLTLIDEQQMLQAFLNVVRNSIEAINHPDGLVSIRTIVEATCVVAEFEDNGCGIPEDRLNQVWEPYYTTKESGTGLGLMIVYRIVREHSGFLSIDSREGEGTTVTIGLPLTEKRVQFLPGKQA